MKLIVFIFLTYGIGILVNGHSWLSCPPSFNTNPFRGGETSNLCERGAGRAPLTVVKAGDRLKLGWTSNNHAGGYVRIALVPFDQANDESISKANVLKFVCFGHDQRPKRSRFGDCQHPCNARGGCDYPKEPEDKERFDTTIGIPTNLEDGIYILQTALLVGNGGSPYYSCAKLQITGGNPGLQNCESNEPPITYTCHKSAGPDIRGHFLRTGAKRGNFCFNFDGTRGTVDDNYDQEPVNIECDPRISCGLSVQSSSRCFREAPSMRTIEFDRRGAPFQPACAGPQTILDNLVETAVDLTSSIIQIPATIIRTTTTRIPSTRNTIATTIPTPSANLLSDAQRFSFNAKPEVISSTITPDRAVYTMEIPFIAEMPKNCCWQIFLQFGFPFHLRPSDQYAVWHQGQLVDRPNDHSLVVEMRGENYPNKDNKTRVGFQIYSDNLKLRWNKVNMEPLTSLVEVHPQQDCYNKLFIEDPFQIQEALRLNALGLRYS